MDPVVLQGTRFAPAYNAAIPAGSLSSNIANLEQYLLLDSSLKTAVVELFFYNFTGTPQDYVERGRADMLKEAWSLNFSAGALRAAVRTVIHNISGAAKTAEIGPGGNYVYAPGGEGAYRFGGFPAGIYDMHKPPVKFALYDPAFDTVRRLRDVAARRGVELIWVATPNHAYWDWFIEQNDAWPLVEEWLTRLTKDIAVVSFSQPNAIVYQNPTPPMKYWNDPFHASLEFGALMLRLLSGQPAPEAPPDFMVKLTPDMVPAHIAARRAAIRAWAEANARFLAEMDAEKAKAAGR
jgi:hypothetical protein